jgi:2-phosphoglycerate kinase
MLYIIGGVPRSGKSIIRKKLLKEHQISGISLDVIVDMLYQAMPELDINTAVDRSVMFVRMWPFVEALIKTRLKNSEDFVIEGEYFSPERVKVFQEDPRCKICFMIYPEISLEEKLQHIRQNARKKDWYNKLTDEEFLPFIQTWHERSHMFKGQCEVHKIKYFDNSFNFEDKIEETVKWLLESSIDDLQSSEKTN